MNRTHQFPSMEAMEEFRAWLLSRPGFIGGVTAYIDPGIEDYRVEWEDMWEMDPLAKKLPSGPVSAPGASGEAL